jgi:hypothetical protein
MKLFGASDSQERGAACGLLKLCYDCFLSINQMPSKLDVRLTGQVPGGKHARGNPHFDISIFALAFFAGAVIAICGYGVDHVIHHTKQLYASDLYTFLVAFLMSYLLMQYEKRRRLILTRRMKIAAEVNHHIRNALTAVVLSASVRNDVQLHDVLEDATKRIDWVLTEVLPDGEDDLKWPVQAPEWSPRSWQGSPRL